MNKSFTIAMKKSNKSKKLNDNYEKIIKDKLKSINSGIIKLKSKQINNVHIINDLENEINDLENLLKIQLDKQFIKEKFFKKCFNVIKEQKKKLNEKYNHLKINNNNNNDENLIKRSNKKEFYEESNLLLEESTIDCSYIHNETYKNLENRFSNLNNAYTNLNELALNQTENIQIWDNKITKSYENTKKAKEEIKLSLKHSLRNRINFQKIFIIIIFILMIIIFLVFKKIN